MPRRTGVEVIQCASVLYVIAKTWQRAHTALLTLTDLGHFKRTVDDE